MSRSVKWLVEILIVVTAISIAAAVFMAAERGDTDDADEERAVKMPSHVTMQNGRVIITLDPQTQAQEGIQVAPLRQASMRKELRGTAVLLSVADLANAQNSYVAARTKLQRDQINLNVSRSQYERIKTLYDQDQNMSLKERQDSEATYRNNEAQVRADEQDAKLQLDTVRQRWGQAANWMATDSPVLQAILEQREFAAQVIFPPGEAAKPPTTLLLKTPANQSVQARYVSSIPQVNPQIQGISFLYVVPGRPGLAVGLNLTVLIPVGHPLKGVVVPQKAAVWWQGKAWAYEATSANTFTRREVPTDNPVASGYFVLDSSFPPGTKLVDAGVQALFSEEFRSQIQQED